MGLTSMKRALDVSMVAPYLVDYRFSLCSLVKNALNKGGCKCATITAARIEQEDESQKQMHVGKRVTPNHHLAAHYYEFVLSLASPNT